MCCLIGGNVHAVSGVGLASARVDVNAPAALHALSDARGDFSLTAPPGTYRIAASAPGYAPVTVAVDATHDVRLQIALEPLDSPKLRPIGEVTVDGRLAPIRGTIPSVTIARADLDALGEDRLVDGLQQVPGATFSRPDGGASSAISVVSLRGPDPSESLLALDGQLLNDGNTGDFDLSRLPVAAFSAIDVTEGLGPEDSNGSNTFGGAIDLISLRPTKDARQAFSVSDGSFGRSDLWFNATGTAGRLGYATAFDDQNETGFVNATVPLYIDNDPACAPCATHLGSGVSAHTALGTLVWSFSQDADVTARIFLLGDRRDQSSAVNGVDGHPEDAGSPQFGQLAGAGPQTFAQTLRAYQIRGRAPLGAGELTTDLSESDNGVDVVGGVNSPYDISHQDRRYNGALTWGRTFADSQFAFGGYTRYESLAADGIPLLGQSIGVLFARGGFAPLPNLRLDGGVFESHYTTFGSNLDGRFGAIFTPEPDTALRFSLGTGFRAPLLAERYQAPYSALTLDGNNVFVGQGNPNEKPEHATEYELGVSHEFAKRATLDFSLYQTNLRDPVEVFYPLAAVDALPKSLCATNSVQHPIAACVSYNSNVGDAVYQGAELRFSERFAPAHLFLTARYGLNVAYPKNLNSEFSNPTSAGNLVSGAQFLGIPQQQGSAELDWSNAGWHAATTATFRGENNELAQPPFAVVDALVGRRLGGGVDLSLAGTNLFNGAAGRYTIFGGGVPYRGLTGSPDAPAYGPLETDALFIEPAAVRLILTVRP
jgi:outer membrane receptor protein involved in Fe transport